MTPPFNVPPHPLPVAVLHLFILYFIPWSPVSSPPHLFPSVLLSLFPIILLHIPSHPFSSLLLLLSAQSLSPLPPCAVGSSEWRSCGSSGSVTQEENIATRGWVNKACYLATPPRPPWELEANGGLHWLLLAGCSSLAAPRWLLPAGCSCYVTPLWECSDGARLKGHVLF